MVQLLIRAVISVIANALGLLAAAYLLNDFEINTSSFIVAVLVFTIAIVVLGPLITKIALTSAPFLVGGIALVTILVALVITSLVTDGLDIDGVATWFIATLIIWGFTLIANLLLPFVLAKIVIGGKPLVPPAEGQTGQR
jgi:putative membrane protein